ncbi:hypothetical protein [Paenibacillus wynnii]|uniref:Uncharacterized protein n=1 Tax=Paenibacillus wynnii TaxID=268407 RepID=A0A098MDL6_9BACL|nr:hypothetical protein [Paenibacillus wynnii]KGE20076.1 hypothetical protein PWYN_12555 [Paenibacillus wynnii]
MKTKVETQIPDGFVLLQNPTNLGNSSEYIFATITTTLKNINYKTVTNLTLDILPLSKINDQIILYSRDVQYVEISPFSNSTTAITIIIKTKSTNKNEIINILKNFKLQLSWGKEYKKVFKFQTIL